MSCLWWVGYSQDDLLLGEIQEGGAAKELVGF